MRPTRAFLAAFALAGLLSHAAAQAPTCTGKNILDELERTDADAHARILAIAAASGNAKAVLWRIEKSGMSPSHLFGTMHLTDERINALSPAVKSALSSSRRLVLELDDFSPDGFLKLLAGSPELVGLMLFTDGRRLDQVLGTDDYAMVREALARFGVPADGAHVFRPWLATMLLSVSWCERQRMTAGLMPLDLQLAKQTERRGIKAFGLETLESQFRALASVPESDQAEMLKAAARLYQRIDDFTETMVQLYVGRDLGAIWPLQLALASKVGVDPRVFASVEQSLLVARNLAMRDKALTHLEGGDAFVAVGALHLPGKHGLVTLLRQAGYTLTAVE